MEQDLGIPSALFAAPVREIVELGKSQIGFMNMFAIPLFQGVTDVMPAMRFCVDELQRNKSVWERKIIAEQARVRQDSEDSLTKDGMFSPRSMSLAQPADVNHAQATPAPPLPDAGDLRKALISKNAFPPARSASPVALVATAADETAPAPSTTHESGTDHPARRSPKPTQLHLGVVTASVTGLPDQRTRPSTTPTTNGGAVAPRSLAPSAVGEDAPAARHAPPQAYVPAKQRSSDGTEGSSSAGGDWASQATSATTNKMPLSPSTKGTSILSDGESGEKSSSNHTSQVVTPTGMATPNGYFGYDGSSPGSPKRSNGNSSELSIAGKEREGRSQSRSGERTDSSSNGHSNGAAAKGGSGGEGAKSQEEAEPLPDELLEAE